MIVGVVVLHPETKPQHRLDKFSTAFDRHLMHAPFESNTALAKVDGKEIQAIQAKYSTPKSLSQV